jgi:prepilin-type N-terminal cleavage/methylation domain-containing protein
MTKNNRNGFTLVELLVVLAIIGLLVSIGLASFSQAGVSGRNSKRKADIEMIRQGLVMYRSNNTGYPVGNVIGAITTPLAGFVNNPFPTDPKSSSTYLYDGTTAKFCICATLEGTNQGNASTAPANGTCAFGTGALYCASSP